MLRYIKTEEYALDGKKIRLSAIETRPSVITVSADLPLEEKIIVSCTTNSVKDAEILFDVFRDTYIPPNVQRRNLVNTHCDRDAKTWVKILKQSPCVVDGKACVLEAIQLYCGEVAIIIFEPSDRLTVTVKFVHKVATKEAAMRSFMALKAIFLSDDERQKLGLIRSFPEDPLKPLKLE